MGSKKAQVNGHVKQILGPTTKEKDAIGIPKTSDFRVPDGRRNCSAAR